MTRPLREMWAWPASTPTSNPVPANNTHRWSEYLGVELELEGVVDLEESPPGWDIHSDASLRRGIEFVTYGAQYGSILEESIDTFYSYGLEWDCSPRTSTHIHVNVRDTTDDTVKTIVMLMYFLEHGLYAAVEESRKWAGYSMPLCEMASSRLRNILNPQTDSAFVRACNPNRNNERYYGLNLSLSRHGTIEFRYFPGGPSRDELEHWIDFVVAIKKAGMKYTIQQLMDRINSQEDLAQLVEEILPAYWVDRILRGAPLDILMEKYLEVAALAADLVNPERCGSIIYLNPLYLGFIKKKILRGNRAAVDLLERYIAGAQMVSRDDWNYYVSQAVSQCRNVPDDLDYDDEWTEAHSDLIVENAVQDLRRVSNRAPTQEVPPAEWLTTRTLDQLYRQLATSSIPAVTATRQYHTHFTSSDDSSTQG